MILSAKIARTEYSFARGFPPLSPVDSPISRSRGGTEEAELDAKFVPAPSNAAANDGDPPESMGNPVPTAPGSTLRGGMEELRFTKLSEKATMPTRAHENDAGLDLYAAELVHIPTGARASVGTGIAVAIPEGLAGLVLPRSGLALKHGVTLINSPGLIDPGYRGEVRVLLLNTDQRLEYQCNPGDRIAQLLLVPIATASPMQANELDSTRRGAGGFGSSGI